MKPSTRVFLLGLATGFLIAMFALVPIIFKAFDAKNAVDNVAEEIRINPKQAYIDALNLAEKCEDVGKTASLTASALMILALIAAVIARLPSEHG
ncbi:hypothetical protein PYJP_04190 [Pyrofollis japonicus]|uniref:hypothetical protein n=1 Tax=Pyrofollis japonicus TaxID=3060460 RepID=UPI00295B1E40|nr:hypothetical protein [Pyrofollis japonicus]BEP17067.1 hypothetical protein PYJP_04190 [Pyrofollis japonicus]